jgi:hypothetical protein
MPRLSPIIELRQYTMVPGLRDDFVDIFDAEFVESQESLGISVIGQFRDLDREHRYVWMRGFPDMEARKSALTAFYDGPVWAEHRDAANATMTEWHDVLLLRPMHAGGFALNPADRPAAGERRPARIIEAIVVPIAADAIGDALPGFAARLSPLVEAAGGELLAAFVTGPSPNTYPRLPIRDDASALVCFSAFPEGGSAISGGEGWRNGLNAALGADADAAVRLRLSPTPRSLLR